MTCTKDTCAERDTARLLMDLAKFQHEVLLEVLDLSDPRSKTPLQDTQMIRSKVQVALCAANKSGLLP